jgi:hypothetical protein
LKTTTRTHGPIGAPAILALVLAAVPAAPLHGSGKGPKAKELAGKFEKKTEGRAAAAQGKAAPAGHALAHPPGGAGDRPDAEDKAAEADAAGSGGDEALRSEGKQVPQAEAAPADAAAAPKAGASAGARGPRERLADLGVFLPPESADHALAEHKAPAGRKAWKGAWAPAFHSAGAMEELLAGGMEGAAAIGRILAPDGGFETPCTSADWVGWYQDRQGRSHRTRSFRVTTERVYDEDGQEVHVVMTAYPIAEFW